VGSTVCLRIDRDAFRSMLDPLHAELRSKMPKDSSPTWLRKSKMGGGSSGGNSFIKSANERAASMAVLAGKSIQRYAPLKDGIQLLKPLGSGGFARVLLAKDNATRRLFALKVIHKGKLLEKKAEARTTQVLNEKLALGSLSHPFITGLHAHYQDAGYLYLLMDLALGGDLFGLMDRHGNMDEAMSRFYTSSLALALQHIHLLEFVYRDLKPENILLDNRGFVKLCDFGFAKKLLLDRTYSQCGTPDYVAPEMLMGQGVNQGCDWWALGVLLYEMISGFPAFTDKGGDNMQTFKNILKGDLEFPPESECTFSPTCKSLVSGMLAVNLASRLGYVNGGAASVISHSWFHDLDWDRLVNLYVDPPWRPTLSNATDTSHFEIEADAANFGEDGKLDEAETQKWKHVWAAFGGDDDATKEEAAVETADAADAATAPTATAPTTAPAAENGRLVTPVKVAE